MSVEARQWNTMIDRLIRNQIKQVTVNEKGKWKHPWQLSPLWDAENERWMCHVEPGFVNGLEAVISMKGKEAPAMTLERLDAAEIDPPLPDDDVDVWLTEGAKLPLSNWRAIGLDAAPTSAGTNADGGLSVNFEEVPAFFQALGVGKPPQIAEGPLGLETTLTYESEERLLRATEVILRQDRKGTRTEYSEGVGLDGQFLQWDVAITQAPNARRRPFLRTQSAYTARVTDDPLRRLQGQWDSETWDDLWLGTIYMVSPPKAARDSEPDQTWQPYLAHRVFWNLMHATNLPTEVAEQENLTLYTGLAGGIGDLLINFLLAQINDANSAVQQFLGASYLEGRFWSV